MKTAYLSMSYDCNEKCVFCPCSVKDKGILSLPLEEMKRCVDEAADRLNVRMFILSGGEPTLKNETLLLMDYIFSKGAHIGLLSNSVKFASGPYMDKFLQHVEKGNLEVTTAFHGYIPEIHDSLTCLPNSFSRSLLGLRNLIRNGIRVSVKYIITRQTYQHMESYIDWLYETFPDEVSLIICNLDLSGIALDNKDCVAISFAESAPFLEKALDRAIGYADRGRKRNIKIFDTPLCTLDPYYWDFVNRGAEEPMALLRVPSQDCFHTELEHESGPVFTACRECAVKDICPGTWKSAPNIFGEEFVTPFREEEV